MCSIVASLSAWRRTTWKTPLPAAASLLSDVTAVMDTFAMALPSSVPWLSADMPQYQGSTVYGILGHKINHRTNLH
jgi:hypothetical protein